MLVAVHGFIVPDLVGEVGVGDGDLRRHVGDDVGIVDDSVSFREAGGDVGGEVLIAHTWLSEGVELIDVSEEVVDIQGGNSGQSRAQAVSSHVDFGIAEKRDQFLDLSADISLHTSEGVIEALVNLASRTSGVGNLNERGDTWVASRLTIQFCRLTVLLKATTMASSEGL